jgi:hypothetical protein
MRLLTVAVLVGLTSTGVFAQKAGVGGVNTHGLGAGPNGFPNTVTTGGGTTTYSATSVSPVGRVHPLFREST